MLFLTSMAGLPLIFVAKKLGCFVLGARYGRGELVMSDGHTEPVYWRGPTIGPDYGGNAAKTFTLIYNLQNLMICSVAIQVWMARHFSLQVWRLIFRNVVRLF